MYLPADFNFGRRSSLFLYGENSKYIAGITDPVIVTIDSEIKILKSVIIVNFFIYS